MRESYLHIYDMNGRCVRSGPIQGNLATLHAGVPVPVLKGLLDLDFVATDWNGDEMAGFATSLHGASLIANGTNRDRRGDPHIVRVKSDAVQRDMRGGAVSTGETIRRGGIAIDLENAWMTTR